MVLFYGFLPRYQSVRPSLLVVHFIGGYTPGGFLTVSVSCDCHPMACPLVSLPSAKLTLQADKIHLSLES